MALNTNFLKKNEKLLSRILLFGAGYMLLVKPILEKVNLISTPEEKRRKAEEEAAKIISEGGSSDSPYNWADFFAKAPKGVSIINEAGALKYAQQIRYGLSPMDLTNSYHEQAAFGVLDAMRTQSQFAWVCRKYYLVFSGSLHEFLKSNLRSSEYADFNLKLMGKPKYK